MRQDSCADFAVWAKAHEPWLKKFLTLKNGTPSSATLYHMFGTLDPNEVETFFRRWVSQIVSAFSTDLGIVFGQERVDEKSNEITAIPKMVEALCVKGFLVSIDAMGCQKKRLPARSSPRAATTC